MELSSRSVVPVEGMCGVLGEVVERGVNKDSVLEEEEDSFERESAD